MATLKNNLVAEERVREKIDLKLLVDESVILCWISTPDLDTSSWEECQQHEGTSPTFILV